METNCSRVKKNVSRKIKHMILFLSADRLRDHHSFMIAGSLLEAVSRDILWINDRVVDCGGRIAACAWEQHIFGNSLESNPSAFFAMQLNFC